MDKADKAVQCFNGGFNCSQSVFSVYAEELGIGKELACKIACAFGGGMGRLCETCGAVTGAYMAIGLKYGNVSGNDKEGRDKTYALVREFSRRFKEKNKSTICKELLGLDFATGNNEEVARQVKKTCPKMVSDSVEILEDLLKDQ